MLYLVKQAAIADADVAPQGRKLPQAALVRDVSQKTDLLSKTCDPMRPVLWPLLFEAPTRQSTPAAPTRAKPSAPWPPSWRRRRRRNSCFPFA